MQEVYSSIENWPQIEELAHEMYDVILSEGGRKMSGADILAALILLNAAVIKQAYRTPEERQHGMTVIANSSLVEAEILSMDQLANVEIAGHA